MVEKLAIFYGSEICKLDGVTYYSFPDIKSLAGDYVEDKLRKNGFGYRSKYISKSAKLIMDLGGEEWINKLKEMKYDNAKKTLMSLTGIGAKVNECFIFYKLFH